MHNCCSPPSQHQTAGLALEHLKVQRAARRGLPNMQRYKTVAAHTYTREAHTARACFLLKRGSSPGRQEVLGRAAPRAASPYKHQSTTRASSSSETESKLGVSAAHAKAADDAGGGHARGRSQWGGGDAIQEVCKVLRLQGLSAEQTTRFKRRHVVVRAWVSSQVGRWERDVLA